MIIIKLYLGHQPATIQSMVTHPLDDKYIEAMRINLNSLPKRMCYGLISNRFHLLRAFVQSLPYTSDLVTTGYDNYPRYPIETLIDMAGIAKIRHLAHL